MMKAKSLFCISILFAILSINVSTYSAAEPGEIKIQAVDSPNDFHFAIMGDRNGGEEKSVFAQVINKVNLMCPAFVVSVGDNIQGYNEDPNKIYKMWDEYDSLIKKLNVPFLKVAGNHDITNDMAAEIYQKRFGRAYYYSIYKNVLFLFLNTDDPSAKMDPQISKELNEEKQQLKEMGKTQGITPQGLMKLQQYKDKHRNLSGAKISDAQFDFFNKVLADNNNVRWTFVAMHKPVWKQTQPPANWVKLEGILKKRQHTVIAGHEHINSYYRRNNSDYIVMSTSGAGRPPKSLPGVYHHILWVTMSGEEPSIANLMADGILEKSDIKPLTDVNSMDVKKMIEEYEGGK
ncbi:MAG: metallophosphoesterase [Planctomycetaceae bacterium]|nr:metallophosphoesterase [Planctomycetaceae bacterium]